MLNLHEVRRSKYFSFYSNSNFIQRNCFLLVLLTLGLFVVFLYGLRPSDDLRSWYNILRGLDSRTFEFLQNNDQLDFRPSTLNRSSEFFTECVASSRTCIIPKSILEMPEVDSTQMLLPTMQVQLFRDSKIKNESIMNHEVYSFNLHHLPKVQAGEQGFLYEHFVGSLKEGEKEAREGVVALKMPVDLADFKQELPVPKLFPHPPKAAFLYQGSFLQDKLQYYDVEQIICSVEGITHIAVVPMAFRNKLYAGQDMKDSILDEGFTNYEDYVRVSPVNRFSPNATKQYPLLKEIKSGILTVERGQCIFIPALTFFQIQSFVPTETLKEFGTFNMGTPEPETVKPGEKIATVVSFVYPMNSALLRNIWNAVEKGILK